MSECLGKECYTHIFLVESKKPWMQGRLALWITHRWCTTRTKDTRAILDTDVHHAPLWMEYYNQLQICHLYCRQGSVVLLHVNSYAVQEQTCFNMGDLCHSINQGWSLKEAASWKPWNLWKNSQFLCILDALPLWQSDQGLPAGIYIFLLSKYKLQILA